MARPKKIQGQPTMRDKIKEEFWCLYEQRPIERISVKEVCEATGCNKTTFYHHFQDLRAVLEEIEEECGERLRRPWRRRTLRCGRFRPHRVVHLAASRVEVRQHRKVTE